MDGVLRERATSRIEAGRESVISTTLQAREGQPPGRRGHDHQGMPHMEDRAVAQTNHTSSEAGHKPEEQAQQGRRSQGAGTPKERKRPLHGLGNGRARYTPTKFWLPSQNHGSSSLTGKFEEPYNFDPETKTLVGG